MPNRISVGFGGRQAGMARCARYRFSCAPPRSLCCFIAPRCRASLALSCARQRQRCGACLAAHGWRGDAAARGAAAPLPLPRRHICRRAVSRRQTSGAAARSSAARGKSLDMENVPRTHRITALVFTRAHGERWLRAQHHLHRINAAVLRRMSWRAAENAHDDRRDNERR